MSFFSSNKATALHSMIVDVEPNSIGIGLTLKGSKKLEYVDKQYIAYEKKPTLKQIQLKLAILLKGMLSSAVSRYLRNGKIVSVLCIHSSAWSLAETHIIDLKFPKPVEVQEKLIVDSVKRHRSNTKNKNEQNNLELMYHQVQKIKLNGYYATEPWGKIAQNISCDLIESYTDSSMRKLCDEILLQFSAPITHIPEAFISGHTARFIFPTIDDFLLIHIGGETTEFTYIVKNHIQKTASAPSGVSNIVRSIADLLSSNVSLAFSHLAMAAKRYRIPTRKEQAVIDESVKNWMNDFIKGISAVCGSNVPENILFFSSQHESHITEFMLDEKKLSAWSGKKHVLTNISRLKAFQEDIMIAAGAQYVVE